MSNQGTLLSNGGLIGASSRVRLKLRVSQGRKPGLQAIVHEVRLARRLRFPEGSRCVLEANHGASGNFDRVDLGAASKLPEICPDWVDLPNMPTVGDLSANRFRFKVVGPDHRILWQSEDIRAGEDEQTSVAVRLLDLRVCPHADLQGPLVDLAPDWCGEGAARIRVSDLITNAQSRLAADEPELIGLVASAVMPQIMVRLFVQLDEGTAKAARDAWCAFMRIQGVPGETLELLRDDRTDASERLGIAAGLAREFAGILIANTATKLEG